MKLFRKWFTLVELIVVITILAILGTIAFISLQWYAKDARDSVRIQDVANIKKSLELFVTETWLYPVPSNATDITYSWWVAWQQWTVWDSVQENLSQLNKKPVDPILETEYSYSRTNSKTEYEISWVLEWWWGLSSHSIINKANAATAYMALVGWNYNGQVLKVSTGGLDYLLALPSITTTDILTTDVVTNAANKSLVYHGEANLASNYSSIEWFTASGWFDYGSSDIVVFKWSRDELWFSAAKVELVKNLQNAYSGTLLSFKTEFSELLSFNAETNRDSATNFALGMFESIPQFSKNLLVAPFEPTAVSWLQLWLDGDDIYSMTKDGSNKVSQWNDKSGNNNHAVQATWDNQPVFTPNGISGRWSLIFDGSNDFLSIANDATLNFDSGAGYTIFLVANYRGYTAKGSSINVLLGKWDGLHATPGYSLETGVANNIVVKTGSNELVEYSVESIQDDDVIITAVMDNAATESKVYRNKRVWLLNTSATVAGDNSGDLVVGADTGSSRYAEWDYAEVLIYNRPLWDAERESVYNYLAKKWNLEFTPRSISDLALWLDASNESTVTRSSGQVTAWQDKSGNGNDLTQGTSSNQPLFQENWFNGRPTVLFDGTDDNLTLGSQLIATGDQWDAFVVLDNLNAGADDDYILSQWLSTAGNRTIFLFHRESGLEAFNGSTGAQPSGSTTLVSNKPYIFGSSYDGTNLAVHINGQQDASISAGAMTLSDIPLYLWSSSQSTRFWNGNVSEVIFFKKKLSGAEKGQIIQYLRNKWGI